MSSKCGEEFVVGRLIVTSLHQWSVKQTSDEFQEHGERKYPKRNTNAPNSSSLKGKVQSKEELLQKSTR